MNWCYATTGDADAKWSVSQDGGTVCLNAPFHIAYWGGPGEGMLLVRYDNGVLAEPSRRWHEPIEDEI